VQGTCLFQFCLLLSGSCTNSRVLWGLTLLKATKFEGHMSFVFFLVKKNYQTAFGCGDNQNKSKKFWSDKQTCLCVCVCVCVRTMYVMDINWPTTQQSGAAEGLQNRLHVNCLWLGCTFQPKNKGLKFSLFPITSFINNMYKQVSWKNRCTLHRHPPLHN